MPQREKPTYEVQGHTFTLRPTSQKNRQAVEAMQNEQQKVLQERLRILQANRDRIEIQIKIQDGLLPPETVVPDEITDIPTFDQYAHLIEMFKIITEGPHDKIDWTEFDVLVAEDARDDFLPESVRTANAIMQSLI